MLMTLWFGPVSLRTFRKLETDLIASQVSFQVQPRVFDERFPRLVLYINDVSASGTQWHGVFLAEAGGENGSRVTLAENAIVIAEPKTGQAGAAPCKAAARTSSSAAILIATRLPALDRAIGPSRSAGWCPRVCDNSAMQSGPLRELARDNTPGWREARVEMYRRFAFPAACFAFALIAVPLGAQPRRGGRAAGSLIAMVLLASYYLLLIMGAGMARQGTLSPATGMWIADAVLAIAGLALLPRMEQFRGESRWFKPLGRFKTWMRLIRVRTLHVRTAAARFTNGSRAQREHGTPSGGEFTGADGFVSFAHILRLFRDTHAGVRLFVRGFHFF